MKVLKPPPIVFRCEACGATNEGEPDEFEPQNTMPPSWTAECGFCHCRVQCFPSALIARAAGTTVDRIITGFKESIVRRIMDS
jgi:hypothetical protein